MAGRFSLDLHSMSFPMLSRAPPPHRAPALDLRLLKPEQARDLNCPICLHMLQKPRQCRNGHMFCLDCITPFLQSRGAEGTCPTCRDRLTPSDLSRSSFAESAIASLEVFCCYHFESAGAQPDDEPVLAEGGCPDAVPLGELPEHERTCPYRWTSCDLSPATCGRLRVRDKPRHQLVCPYRRELCEWCSGPVAFVDKPYHRAICPAQPSPCPACGATLPRKELATHCSRDCAEALISCCGQEMKRRELPAHLAARAGEHLSLLTGKLAQYEEQRDRDRETINRLELQLRVLEHRYADSRAPEHQQVWRVASFSKIALRPRSYVRSSNFVVHGVSFYCGLFTNGYDAAHSGWLSLFVFPVAPTVRASVRVSISVINHHSEALSVHREFQLDFAALDEEAASAGGGVHELLRAERVTETAGWLRDDTLSLLVDFKVVAIESHLRTQWD